jgi:hypothetical protein
MATTTKLAAATTKTTTSVERLVRVTRSRPDEATEPVRIVTQAGVI